MGDCAPAGSAAKLRPEATAQGASPFTQQVRPRAIGILKPQRAGASTRSMPRSRVRRGGEFSHFSSRSAREAPTFPGGNVPPRHRCLLPPHEMRPKQRNVGPRLDCAAPTPLHACSASTAALGEAALEEFRECTDLRLGAELPAARTTAREKGSVPSTLQRGEQRPRALETRLHASPSRRSGRATRGSPSRPSGERDRPTRVRARATPPRCSARTPARPRARTAARRTGPDSRRAARGCRR